MVLNNIFAQYNVVKMRLSRNFFLGGLSNWLLSILFFENSFVICQMKQFEGSLIVQVYKK